MSALCSLDFWLRTDTVNACFLEQRFADHNGEAVKLWSVLLSGFCAVTGGTGSLLCRKNNKKIIVFLH